MEDTLALVDELTPANIASICDHTYLASFESFGRQAAKGENPIRLRAQGLRTFLETSMESRLVPYLLCVRSEHVPTVVEFLNERGRADMRVAAAICFPEGFVETDFKVSETRLAISHGATEVDVVLNYDKLKSGDFEYARDDARAVADAAHEDNALMKVILETSELSKDQIRHACELSEEAGADFVKTTTALPPGATAEDLKIMRENFSRGVKLSGAAAGKPENIRRLLKAASGRTDGYIDLTPSRVRIGESGLLAAL